MKTKIILNGENENARQSNKEFEKQYMSAVLLSLYENKMINYQQYEECKRRLKIVQLDFEDPLHIMCVESGRRNKQRRPQMKGG